MHVPVRLPKAFQKPTNSEVLRCISEYIIERSFSSNTLDLEYVSDQIDTQGSTWQNYDLSSKNIFGLKGHFLERFFERGEHS